MYGRGQPIRGINLFPPPHTGLTVETKTFPQLEEPIDTRLGWGTGLPDTSANDFQWIALKKTILTALSKTLNEKNLLRGRFKLRRIFDCPHAKTAFCILCGRDTILFGSLYPLNIETFAKTWCKYPQEICRRQLKSRAFAYFQSPFTYDTLLITR